jgi:hypothetical protein
MKPLPAHEQLSVSTDLPLIEGWIDDNLVTAQATVAIDRAAFDSNMGHVLLVVSVRQLSELDRAREELTALVTYPDRLRVRHWMPTEALLQRIHDWIWSRPTLPGSEGTEITSWGPHPTTGRMLVTLNRKDPAYAAYLYDATGGIIDVDPEPENFVNLTALAGQLS